MQLLRQEGINVIAIHEQRSQQYLRSWRALKTGEPLQVAFGASSALRSAIREQLEPGAYDLVHIEFIRAIGALPEQLPLPVVWDAVDCVSQLYEQGAKYGATRMLRVIGKYEARRVRQFEQQQLRRFRHVLVTSERDRLALENLSAEQNVISQRAEITSLPHGIDQEYYQPYEGSRRADTLVFSGKMSFHANIAGVLYFTEQVLPLIWLQRPQVRLVIAGSNPLPALRRLTRDPRIEVTGYVPDLRPSIAESQVAISPLPYAVGIQNKVLEAMALGTPVVSTSSASAGLHCSNDQAALRADRAADFASLVLRLLDDPVFWRQQAEWGKQYIRTHHDWDQILSRLTDVYQRAVSSFI
jgi:glycosyltransferase involved in cell wall biosynthesis